MADPSKTESATPRRKEDARKRGQVPKSSELTTALAMLGSIAVLSFSGATMTQELAKIARFSFGNLNSFTINDAEINRHALHFGLELLFVMGPLLLGAFVIGILANVLQIGFLFAPQVLEPKPENLSPAKGWERIYSRRSVVELFKGFLKIGVVGLVAWSTLRGRSDRIFALMNTDLGLFLGEISALSSILILRVSITLLVLALADYLYQRFEYDESLKMTKQEIKDEYRQMEGDPQVKARIRRLQQEASRRRMLAELPNADVVITNPTRLAVAIKYDGVNMDSPIVIAKGARLVAARIREIAREHRIPVIENKPLARALFEGVPVGAAVPSLLFNAVAELLAWVYQTQGRLEEKALQNQDRLRRLGRLPAHLENDATGA